jgi:hypothetical protein
MIATAENVRTSGIGTGSPGVFVYLNWTTGSQDRAIILALVDGSTERVEMKWLTPTNLQLTYVGDSKVEFQALKCHFTDICVRHLSNQTSARPK